MNKNALRQVVREQKRQFSGEQLRELSLSICQTLLSHSAIKQANTILLYASLPDEVQTNTLLATLLKQKKRILLPVVVDETSLELREYKGKEELETGAFGIEEPKGKAFTAYSVIDVVVVPGMAFDSYGNRLGRGKGYYDRLLSLLPHAYKIGIAFPFQIFTSIPVTPHDIIMNEVISQ